jgi:hypothetical protein
MSRSSLGSGLSLDATPLAGRPRELSALWAGFQRAQQGHGGITLVTGESGIGKTRLLDELANLAASSGAAVLRGGAAEADGMPPYLPFLEAIGSYIGAAAQEPLVEQAAAAAPMLATILPELVDRLGVLPMGQALPAEQARLRLFEAVGTFLAVPLGPLASDELGDLAAAQLGGEVDDELAVHLHAHSDGNPFFAEELLRDWLDRDVIAATEDDLIAAAEWGLVRREGPHKFAFCHDRTRECLYTEISETRRERLHLAIGEALERSAEPANAQHLAALAFHFARSDAALGRAYAWRAIQHALQGEWREVDLLLAVARPMTERLASTQQLSFVRQLRGFVALRRGEWAQAVRGPPETSGARPASPHLATGDWDAASAHLSMAAETAERERLQPELGCALLGLAELELAQGRRGGAARAEEDAVVALHEDWQRTRRERLQAS